MVSKVLVEQWYSVFSVEFEDRQYCLSAFTRGPLVSGWHRPKEVLLFSCGGEPQGVLWVQCERVEGGGNDRGEASGEVETLRVVTASLSALGPSLDGVDGSGGVVVIREDNSGVVRGGSGAG